MDHMTELFIIVSNIALFGTNIGLIIVTGMDNHSMAKLLALAISRISPTRVIKIEHRLKEQKKI